MHANLHEHWERERARRQRNARESVQEMPATCCCLLSSLSSRRHLLSLWSVSLFVALSVLFASSRQIVLASSLILLHQSAFKRDGVHLVEPIDAVYNSRVCVYVCVCEWVSAKWFLPFKLTTINILSNELVSVLYHHTYPPPTHSAIRKRIAKQNHNCYTRSLNLCSPALLTVSRSRTVVPFSPTTIGTSIQLHSAHTK